MIHCCNIPFTLVSTVPSSATDFKVRNLEYIPFKCLFENPSPKHTVSKGAEVHYQVFMLFDSEAYASDSEVQE